MNTINAMKEALLAFSGMPLTYTRKAQIEGLLRDAIAAEEAQTEPYDQQALETCDVCGWKAIVPGEPCLVCERNAKMLQPEHEPVDGVVVRDNWPTLLRERDIKSTDLRLYTKPQPVADLTDDEIVKIAIASRGAEPGHDGYILPLTFARAVLAAQKGKT